MFVEITNGRDDRSHFTDEETDSPRGNEWTRSHGTPGGPSKVRMCWSLPLHVDTEDLLLRSEKPPPALGSKPQATPEVTRPPQELPPSFEA